MKILVEGQFIEHSFFAEYRQGKNDIVNIKIENIEQIKKMLLALYSDLNCFIGDQTRLIYDTDIIIMKLQGKSLNKEFLHLTDAEFLKESKKLKDYRIPYYYDYECIYLDKSYTKKEKELALNFEIDKIGTWLFAFLILAYRNKDNSHFINLFKKFDINDLNCLKDCFETFNNGFKEWRKNSKG